MSLFKKATSVLVAASLFVSASAFAMGEHDKSNDPYYNLNAHPIVLNASDAYNTPAKSVQATEGEFAVSADLFKGVNNNLVVIKAAQDPAQVVNVHVGNLTVVTPANLSAAQINDVLAKLEVDAQVKDIDVTVAAVEAHNEYKK
ncbi:hypothetical protein [Psittacicella hinzii]|uniref:Uncharacterized protein n=1 Tax=Psittacicella hinzii TaxID=2028575 RepID=A0A3A1YT15_9GAMM|nr:hypothetical protein [Psittacicella hinzii]RIY39177.1 hypothetical protein CKF58_02595 [Psittacicella hinzii]